MKEIIQILRGAVPDVGPDVHRFLFNSEDIETSKTAFKNAVMEYLDVKRYYTVNGDFPMGRQGFVLHSMIKVQNETYLFKCRFAYPSKPEFTLLISSINTEEF